MTRQAQVIGKKIPIEKTIQFSHETSEKYERQVFEIKKIKKQTQG
jgi:hypothetical protein